MSVLDDDLMKESSHARVLATCDPVQPQDYKETTLGPGLENTPGFEDELLVATPSPEPLNV